MIARPSRSRARSPKADAPPPAPMPMPTPPMPPAPTPRPMGGSTKMVSYPMVVVGIMLTAAAVLGVLQVVKGKGTPPVAAASTDAAPTADAPSDDAALIARVSTLISVNPDETPTIAAVQNPETLKSQNPSFYKDVEVGDRLLLWSDKAVLFSVKRNVILNAIMISAPPAKEASTENAVIEVRNGSSVAGMGRAAASRLTTVGLTVLPATDANIKTYQKTLIVVPPEKAFPMTIQKIRESLGVNAEIVSSTEEAGAKGDILVIIGPDFKR